jgi:hypothetical protein
MKKWVLIILMIFGFIPAYGIGPNIDKPIDTVATPESNLPIVNFVTDDAYLLKAFYPAFYSSDSPLRQAIKDAEQRSGFFTAIWDSLGDSILATISSLSGIAWYEPGLKIHLLKFMPIPRLYEPLAVPIEGIKSGSAPIIAVPPERFRFLQLVQILAGRNLLQADYPGNQKLLIISHPLYSAGPYRFDLLATTLALAAARAFIPGDTLAQILDSDEWHLFNPGWQIFNDNFRKKWILSPAKTLIDYLMEESFDSPLVELTAISSSPLKDSTETNTEEKVTLTPSGNRLGFTAVTDREGYLRVISIDTTKLAYSCGLRVGDRIQRVNGEAVKTLRDMINKSLEALDLYGVYLIVLRGAETKGLFLHSSERKL